MHRASHILIVFGAVLIGAHCLHGAPASATQSESRPTPTIETPLPTPGMGWSTYNFFVARHNAELFKRTAQAYTDAGLRDAGYMTLRIDGGWWGDDSNRRWYYWTEKGTYEGGAPYQPGDPHVDPKNYPQGLKALAGDLHERGFKLGFYLAPELSTGISDNYPGNKETKQQPPVTGLALIEQHARWAANNGVDHLFYDGYDWNQSKGEEAYIHMFRSLRKEAARVERPIAFSINSGWKARPRDWADEWRTSPDINGEWRQIRENLASCAEPGKTAGKGHWNNPDYLMVGFVEDELAKSQMSLWCVIAAPLYLSHDFRVLNDWDRYVLLNTEAIAVNQDPAGMPGRRLRSDATGEIWARSLADGSQAVVLLNADDKPKAVSIGWDALGIAAGPVQVRDLWAHQNLGALDGGYTTAELPPRGCSMIRVKAGADPLALPEAKWAKHPGKKPALVPLSTTGWTATTNMSRKDDPLPNLFDGDAKTGWWSYAGADNRLDIDFGKLLTFDRVVIDHRGVGPNPWPYKVHALRSTFSLQVSEDGKIFRPVAEDSFGPSYTRIDVEQQSARYLRVVIKEIERTSAYSDTSWHAKDVFLFNTAVQQGH